MYRKREREFQYPPGIEKIIEDVIGGGTIDRRDLQNALFNGKALDELPPIVIVVKDPETGLYHVLKTAMASDAGSETTYKVAKNHLFGVGDFVTIGGALTGASDKITAIDKSNADFDTITLAATIGAATKGQVLATIGAATKGQVLVQAKDKQAAKAAKLPYDGELVVTMNKVDLTVANQQSGLLVRGTVNESCMPFPVDKDLKTLMSFIRFV